MTFKIVKSFENYNQRISNIENHISIDKHIFDKIKSCSTVNFVISGIMSSGSGWFYYETKEDLKEGLFITAAHCVINNNLTKVSNIWIINPITNSWKFIDKNDIYIDGISDIALIRSRIDLTNYPEYCLQLSEDYTKPGDVCYIIGNPGGIDEDSITVGCVRDNHYMEPYGYQITDSIHISAPGIGGNSGSPILNKDGYVIGIFTFGSSEQGRETFGGGSNLYVLRKSLSVLKKFNNNKLKRYLGINWSHYLHSYYLFIMYYINKDNIPSNGVMIYNIDISSPFYGILEEYDLLLEAKILDTGEIIKFGIMYDQRTPGILIHYSYLTYSIEIKYIRFADYSNIKQSTVILDKSYNDSSPFSDLPLIGGYNNNKNTLDNYPEKIQQHFKNIDFSKRNL